MSTQRFACNFCNATFSRNNTLNKHLTDKHHLSGPKAHQATCRCAPCVKKLTIQSTFIDVPSVVPSDDVPMTIDTSAETDNTNNSAKLLDTSDLMDDATYALFFGKRQVEPHHDDPSPTPTPTLPVSKESPNDMGT